MNKVELIGNLTKEPDVRFTKSGKAVASFTVACNNGRNRQTGEEYAPDYVPCEAWEKTAERMGEMGKGAYVLVMGKSRHVPGMVRTGRNSTKHTWPLIWSTR